MFIIWGIGKTTRKVVGEVGYITCNRCNTQSLWELCIIRTWFTLFFIPIIPYSKKYCISCPNCESYYELSQEEFEQYRNQIECGDNGTNASDEVKYRGKTQTQINYLKQMEEIENND